MEVRILKSVKYGDVTTLIGCVTPASAVIGTDEEWDQECRDSIDAMAKGGGFVLAAGCEYPANASFDRAQRMVEIAKTYGKYEAAQICIDASACKYTYFKKALSRLVNHEPTGNRAAGHLPEHENIRGRDCYQ